MIDINKLIAISEDLKLDDKVADLTYIKSRLDEPNKEIFIPLVGEFSSGKTSLINALTESKKLETASKATTATIFEIRFGCEKCHAEVIDANDNVCEIDDIAELKNDRLNDAKLVRVFDTSKQVPPSTILVDTPGLSSNDPRHKIALTSYLPQSDAILLVTDINQQITRSLIDFVNTTKLTNKPIYLVITKCDTKTQKEIESVKDYIKENIKLPLENIVCVSALKNQLEKLYKLFNLIQNGKNDIVSRVLDTRIKNIASSISDYVNNLIEHASQNTDVEKQFDEQQRKLEKISANIDRLIRDSESKIEEKSEECVQKFKNTISTRLDEIVQTQGQECDEAVYSTVNTLASLSLANYKKDIQSIIINLARDRQRSIDAVPLQSLESLDMTELTFNPFTYNMQLSQMGHEKDKMIGGIVKVGLAVAAVATVAAVAAPAAAAGGAAAGGEAAGGVAASGAAASGATEGVVTAGTVADLALDAHQSYNIQKMAKYQAMMEKTQKYASSIEEQTEKIEGYNNKIGSYTPQQKGIIETGVSWITEHFEGKPQRRRAVNNYVEGTLMPEFENGMENFRGRLVRMISDLVHQEAQTNTLQMEEALRNMKEKQEKEKESYKQEISKLKEYKSFLNII